MAVYKKYKIIFTVTLITSIVFIVNYSLLKHNVTVQNQISLNFWLYQKLLNYIQDALHKKITKQSNLIKWFQMKISKK